MRNKLGAFLVSLLLLYSSPVLAATTWDSGNCNVGITLTVGDTVATRTAASWVACKSTTSHNFDRNYVFKMIVDDDSISSHGIIIGVGNATASNGNFVGADANSCGVQTNNAGVWGCINVHNGFAPYGTQSGDTSVYFLIQTSGVLSFSIDACATWYNLGGGGVGNITSTASPVFIMASLLTDGGSTFEKATIDPNATGCIAPGYFSWEGNSLGGSTGGAGLLLRGVGG